MVSLGKMQILRLAREACQSKPGRVASFARAHGVIDLAPDDDTRLLAARLAGETGRLVLNVEEKQAYKWLTDRVLAMFHLNDPLARFLYRGR